MTDRTFSTPDAALDKFPGTHSHRLRSVCPPFRILGILYGVLTAWRGNLRANIISHAWSDTWGAMAAVSLLQIEMSLFFMILREAHESCNLPITQL